MIILIIIKKSSKQILVSKNCTLKERLEKKNLIKIKDSRLYKNA